MTIYTDYTAEDAIEVSIKLWEEYMTKDVAEGWKWSEDYCKAYIGGLRSALSALQGYPTRREVKQTKEAATLAGRGVEGGHLD